MHFELSLKLWTNENHVQLTGGFMVQGGAPATLPATEKEGKALGRMYYITGVVCANATVHSFK